MQTMSIGLLGLGTKGSGMAANLLKAGFPLAVWNRTRSKAEPFAAAGARVADTPADAARGAQLIFSMLADDIDLLRSGAPGSPLVAGVVGRMTTDLETTNFSLALLAKDVGYAHETAAETGVDRTTATCTKQLLNRAIAAGYGDKDMSNVVELLRHSRP